MRKIYFLFLFLAIAFASIASAQTSLMNNSGILFRAYMNGNILDNGISTGINAWDFKTNRDARDIWGSANGISVSLNYGAEGAIFNGSQNKYIIMPEIGDGLSSITIGATFIPYTYSGTTGSSERTIIGKTKWDGVTDSYALALTGFGGTEMIRCAISNGTYNLVRDLGVSGNIPLNLQSNVNCVWTSGGKLYMYVNGVYASETTDTMSGKIYDTNYQTMIGRSNYTSSNQAFNGTINKVIIYDRALSASEILALNNTPYVPVKNAKYNYNGIVASYNYKLIQYANDASGNGYNGIVTGTTTNGNGFTFNGISDYINTTIKPNITNNDNYTIHIRFIPRELDDYEWLVWKEANSFGFSSFGVGIWNSRQINCYVSTDVSDYASNYYLADSSYLNKVYDVSCVKNSTTLQIYVNGEIQPNNGNQNNRTTFSGTIRPNGNINFIIGRDMANGNYFNGTIERVDIYNRSLTANEIRSLYFETNYTDRNNIENRSLLFNNTNKELIRSNFWLNSSNQYSASFWAKKTESSNTTQDPFTISQVYVLRFLNDSTTQFYHSNDSVAWTPININGTDQMQWHNYLATCKNGNFSAYIDGQYKGSIVQGSCRNQTSDLLYLGNSNWYNGKLDDVTIWNRSLSIDEIGELYNGNINHLFYNVTPSIPVTGFQPTSTSNLDCLFTVNDTDSDALNVTVNWYKNGLLQSLYSYTFANVNMGNQYQTALNQGRVNETLVQGDVWYCNLIDQDAYGSTNNINTANVTVSNSAPTIDWFNVTNANGMNNTFANKANKGETIKFTLQGNDHEDNYVQLRVCSGTSANWTNCTVLCENTSSIQFRDVVDGLISCSYATNDTQTNNSFRIVLRDTPSNAETYNNSIYYVNQPTNISPITTINTYGDTTYYYGEYLDYIDAEIADAENGNNITTYLTLRDPDGTVVINNVTMPYVSGTKHRYDNNTLLNAVGNWNISVSVTDLDNYTSTNSTILSVGLISKTTDATIYGWDYYYVPIEAEIRNDIQTYGFKYIEIEFNDTSLSWSNVTAMTTVVKNESALAIITIKTNLSNSSAYSFVNTNYGDLIGANYVNNIFMLNIEVPLGTTVNSTNDGIINNITKSMLQKTANKFPVKIKNYISAGINQNYGQYNTISYINATDQGDLINKEALRLRNGTKNRMYKGSTDKGQVSNLNFNVFSKLRSTIKNTTAYASNVAQLTNLDIVVFNNASSQASFNITVNSTLVGKDVYDYSKHKILLKNLTSSINVTVDAYSAEVIYFENLAKIAVQDNDKNYLYSSTIGNVTRNENYMGITQGTWKYTESSTNNHYDGMMILNDPNFQNMDFYIYYGSLAELGVDNLSIYKTVILADNNKDTCGTNLVTNCNTLNGSGNYATCINSYVNVSGNYKACVMPDLWGTAVCEPRTLNLGSAINGTTGYCNDNVYDDEGMFTKVVLKSGATPYGYMAVDDYCNPTSWTETDRQNWITTKKNLASYWMNINQSVNIFIDGYDIGDNAVCTNSTITDLFESSVQEIADYIRVAKGRKVIFNTYTQYQNVVHMADGIMKESCIRRWDNTVDSPIYSWENFSIELARYKYFQAFGVDVYCQSFGQQNDSQSAYYSFLAGKVLGYQYVSYNQPKFWYGWYNGLDDNWNFIKYPNVGATLDADLTDEGNGVYSRRFENGIIRINTTSHTGQFISDQVIQTMQLCAYLKDGTDTKEGRIRFTFNNNYTGKQAYINDSDVSTGSFNKYCMSLDPNVFYEPSGYYNIKFYYECPFGSCSAMTQSEIRTSLNATLVGGRRSGLDDGSACNEDHTNQVLGGYQPDLCDSTYLTHTSGWDVNFDTRNAQQKSAKWYNFDMNLEINRTGSRIVDVIPGTIIARSESGIEKKTVNFNSLNDYNISVYDKLVFMNKSLFNNMYVNGSALNYSNSSFCISDSPTYSNTTVSGDVWKACYYDNDTGSTGYYVRVIVPHLSNMNYTIDANQLPVISSQNLTLINLLNGNQTWEYDFAVSDPDNNSIQACGAYVNGVRTSSGSYANNMCNVSLSSYMNASNVSYIASVRDSYDDEKNGTLQNGITTAYDKLIRDESKASNFSIVFVKKQYNLTQGIGNFNNIVWQRNSTDFNTTISLTNGTSQVGKDFNISGMFNVSNYFWKPQVDGFYFVDSGYNISKNFTLNYSMTSTLGSLPILSINYPADNYVSGTQIVYFNGSFMPVQQGSTIVFNTTEIKSDSVVSGNISHNAKVVYSEGNTVTYVDNGAIRTYNWRNGQGKNIKFMNLTPTFPINSGTKIFDYINYSLLPNIHNSLTITHNVTDELGNEISGRTFYDNYAQSQAEMDFYLQASDNYYVYKLAWTYMLSAFCGDGTCGGDESCTSCSQDCGSCSAGGGGGGGGGGSSTTEDSNKPVCDVELTPTIVKFTPNSRLQKITVFNKGDISYQPTFEFTSSVENYTKVLSVTNTINVLSGQGGEFGVRINPFTVGDATLSLKSDSCKDMKIYITSKQIDTPLSVVEDLFDSNKKIIDIATEPVFSELQPELRAKTPYFTVGIVLLICLLLYAWMMYNPIKKTIDKEKYLFTIIWIAFLVGIAFATTVFIVTGLRYIGI